MGIPLPGSGGVITQVVTWKRGSTLAFNCTYTQDNPAAPADLTGVGITSQAQDANGFMWPFQVTVLSPTSFNLVYVGDTSNFAVGQGSVDICLDYSGSIFYTETWLLNVELNVTPSPTAQQ